MQIQDLAALYLVKKNQFLVPKSDVEKNFLCLAFFLVFTKTIFLAIGRQTSIAAGSNYAFPVVLQGYGALYLG